MQNEDSRMQERTIYDIGFVDCQFIREITLKEKPNQTENNLLQLLTYFGTRREILFPYNFE